MATLYYKATRPDGCDFHTGTVDYAVHLELGTPLPEITHGVPSVCTDTVYHASDTPAETLIGGQWPCRLFEVTGSPVAADGHKIGFRTLTVVREVEAWRALGPQGYAVSEMIRQAAALTADQATRIAAARHPARDATREAMWGAARGAARGAAWGATRGAARGAAWDAAREATWGATRDAARGATRDAARDAARGLVVRDLIPAGAFDALAGPWISVMGDPALLTGSVAE